jgi:hypothetical protein
MTETLPAACFVRARVVAGGVDGRVLLVRVGWLTPELAAAIADDVCHAPTGTWLELLVADDLTDTDLARLRKWLRFRVSPHVVDVRRATELPIVSLSPSATPDRDRLTHDGVESDCHRGKPTTPTPGIDLAPSEEQKRRSEQ